MLGHQGMFPGTSNVVQCSHHRWSDMGILPAVDVMRKHVDQK